MESLRSERGAQLVELAFIMPVVLALLLGIVTGGIAFNRSNSIQNAARESARYGATLPVDGNMSGWLSDVADVAIRSATGDLDDGLAGRQVCVAYVHPDGTDPADSNARLEIDAGGVQSFTTGAPCFADGRPSDERRVQIRAQSDSELAVFFFSQTLQVTGESVVRYERAG